MLLNGYLNSSVHCSLVYQFDRPVFIQGLTWGGGGRPVCFRLSGYYSAILLYQANQFQEFSVTYGGKITWEKHNALQSN